jgi:glucoamylase
MEAPGKPGVAPRWTTGRKSAVGTSRSPASHVWFTVERGILSEVYYPRVDQPAIRDLGLIVSDGAGFFSEEKSDTDSTVRWVSEGVPAFQVANVCRSGRYAVEKTIVTDPERHVLLQRRCFAPKAPAERRYHLYALLAPHLGNSGVENDARVGDYDGVPMLLAERPGYGLALACSAPWLRRSAGYVGVSDGWQDVHAHGHMTWQYETATQGNVALIGEIEFADGVPFVLALGFGRTAKEAAERARLSLNHGFDAALLRYTDEWSHWQRSLHSRARWPEGAEEAYRASAAVLAVHESKEFPGATIASLALPWGEIRGGEIVAGYHVMWPRDSYEAATALLALGATAEIVRALDFCAATQLEDGSWPQNMWLDGSAFGPGLQLDEVACPLLLFSLARRHDRLTTLDVQRLWPMLRRAAAFIVQRGPVSPEDRWEDAPGMSPFTLGCVIAALLIAAELADEHAEPKLAGFLRETADDYHAAIDDWLYAEGTPLARELGIDGYYVRIAPPEILAGDVPLGRTKVPVVSRGVGAKFAADTIVSVDALALVRFGLRRPDDPRILNTLRAIDALLRVETPLGPCWRRYTEDGYGERADGSPFSGSGIGRAWPLLVGERAHFELTRGNREEARRLLEVMQRFGGATHLLPEQVWDAPAIAERALFPGGPTASACPLVWAHAEHVKLLRSLEDGAVFDSPPQTRQRYLGGEARPAHVTWRFERPLRRLRPSSILRLETRARAKVRWSDDDWSTVRDAEAVDTGLGLFVTDLPTATLEVGRTVRFTYFWPESGRWEGRDFHVEVGYRDRS